DDWIKVNAGQSGFYRVNYPAEEWARLRRAVAEKQLDTSDRIGLQNDAYDLTRAGYLPATTFLELTSEYRDEDDVTAWRMIVESKRLTRSLKDPPSLHPDLRGLVYSLVAQGADPSTYETLWDLEQKAGLQEEKVRLLLALTKTRDAGLLQETLRRSLTDAVRSQDAVLVITNVATSRPSLGRDLAWSFVKKNWDELYRLYSESGFLFRLHAEIAQAFT